MGSLEGQLEAVLPLGMHVPSPIRSLFEWIESRGLYVDRSSSERIGFLFSPDEIRAQTTQLGRPGGTKILFAAEGNLHLKHWFGHERADVLDRLCVFATTGGEGSMAAFWLDDQGRQVVVHLGSGSGSTMVCVLAEHPIDFLRLMAVGYEELCWGSQFAVPPVEAHGEFTVAPNEQFREWVTEAFNVLVPERGTDIVPYPDDMGIPQSKDRFNRWVSENVA